MFLLALCFNTITVYTFSALVLLIYIYGPVNTVCLWHPTRQQGLGTHISGLFLTLSFAVNPIGSHFLYICAFLPALPTLL